MAPHQRDRDNQTSESSTRAVPPMHRRKSLNASSPSSFSTSSSSPIIHVMRDIDPTDEHSAERTVDTKEPSAAILDSGHNSSSSSQAATTPSTATPRRKRDVVRQISMRLYLKGKDIAEDVMRNVALQRIEDAETVCSGKDSSLEHELPASRKTQHQTRKHLWLPTTQDDSVLLHAGAHHREVNDFFVSRVTDPTSFFFRFRYDDHRHLAPQKAEVQLVDIAWLKAHEAIVSHERVDGLRRATLTWDAFTEPLLVDRATGTILDGHHRFTVGVQLRLSQLPAVLVDYLEDDLITVDVWPGCGRQHLTKHEVIAMALSPNVFPPKTSRHRFTESLPPISIPLSVLRQPPVKRIDPVAAVTATGVRTVAAPTQATVSPAVDDASVRSIATVQQQSQAPHTTAHTTPSHVSIDLICGLASTASKSLFRSRLRQIASHDGATQLDMIKRPAFDATNFFNAVREHDPTSSFCQQRSATLDDLLTADAATRQTFFASRICDPTSYFFKYHFDAQHKRSPVKVRVQLAAIAWLKAHEHVVSWDRVDGLRRATKTWDAYLEPLLVDAATGAILDGHHRFHVGRQLGLMSVPVVLVDYLTDDSITVDVWPNCGRDSLTKDEVIAMSLSDGLFPPKTSRHTFSDDLPPISVPLARLREPLAGNTSDL